MTRQKRIGKSMKALCWKLFRTRVRLPPPPPFSQMGQSPPRLFFLERQRFAPERRHQLAEKLSPALHLGQHHQAGRFGQALSSAYVSGHVRGGDAACGRADRSGFDPARSHQREDHREALSSPGSKLAKFNFNRALAKRGRWSYRNPPSARTIEDG